MFPQSTSFYLKEPLFHVKRAFLRYEESLSSHQRNAPFICKQWSSLPSPFGEGAGVRLLLICKQWFSLPSPFGEGLGERLSFICKQLYSLPSPFGEGAGVRLSFICKQWSSLPSPFVEGLVVRLLVESKKGVSFCVFPCSFRNSVSLSGSVPFVYSVLKMP